METNAKYFDCLCRTCMNKVEASSHDGTFKPQQQWLSIFELIDDCSGLRIAELLSEAVPQIVVQPSDQLPKKICTECLQRLLSVYRFQQMCVQSDKQMHELLSKEQIVLKTPMLEEAIKGETETNDADSQPLKDLAFSSTLQNLQQPSIQESFAEVTVQTNEPEAVQSNAAEHLQESTQLLEQCMDAQGEFEEFIKNEPNEGDEATTHLKTPVLEEAIKGETETNDADTQPLKDLAFSSTLQNLQQASIQESFAEVTVQTNEPEAVQSSAAEHLQENTQLLEHFNDSIGEFGAFIKNEPIEDDEANSEYSDGDTMHSIISVNKDEPIELEDQQENVISSRYSCHLCNKSYKHRDTLRAHLKNHKKKATNSKEYCYACHLCSESYNGQRYLTKHLKLAHSIEPQLTCDVCNKSLASSFGLRLHKRIHTGERPYVCSECGKSFTQQSSLAAHRNIHSGDKPYECPCCPLRFTSKAKMTRHKNSRHEETVERYECDICGKKLSSKSILVKHKLIHSGGKPHKCDFCEKRFVRHNQLLIHNRTHTGDKRYKCKYCECAYTTSNGLLMHSRRHLGANVYRCKFCPLAFPLDSELRLHLTLHKNEDPETRERNLKALQEDEAKLELKFSKERAERQSTEEPSTEIKRHKCDICGKKFRQKCELTRHKRIHSKNRHLGKNIYRCKFCPLALPSSAERRLHLASHKNEDPEVRERNLKALQEEEVKLKLKFSKEKSKGQSTEEQPQQKLSKKETKQPSTDILAVQHTTYAEDKPYECPYCPLRFSSKQNSSLHKAVVHEGAAKQYQCDICGTKFRQKSALKCHKLIHSKEKRYKCDLCEKQFTHMQPLQIHIRTHTGEKPFKCKYCQRGFAATSILAKHLRTHLGKNIYRCKFCPLAFPLASEMRLHLTSHKNEDREVRDRNLKALHEEEAELKLKFSKGKSKGESTEEQQQEKLCNKEIEQQSTDSIQAEQRTTQVENKSYECPYCPLIFSSRSNVSKHKKIHDMIKPHKCSICGKQFRETSDLTKHKRTHCNEKPHKCDVCEKRYTQMQELKIHIRTHTGEKPFKCKYCERGFAARSLLSQHLRTHLGKNIYRCKFCPLAFPSSAEMRLHLTSHKNEDPEVRERNLKALQEEEAKLKLKFSKEISKGQSTEEQQQQKLSNTEIEQPSTDLEEFEEFIKNEPIEDGIFNMKYSDGDTMNSTISVNK